jgi:hypothetical protein
VQLHLLNNDALDSFQKLFEWCFRRSPQNRGMIFQLRLDAAENLLCSGDVGDALGAGDAQRAEELFLEIFGAALLVEQNREEREIRVELGAPTEYCSFLLDPVRPIQGSSGEEDDRRVTLGQPFVEPPLPVVAGMQTLVVDQNLDLVGVLGLQRLAGVLQQLPVGLRLGVIRTGGTQSGTVADEKFESRHVGFSCGVRCVVGRALFLQEPTTHRASQAVVARFVGLRSSAQPTKACWSRYSNPPAVMPKNSCAVSSLVSAPGSPAENGCAPRSASLRYETAFADLLSKSRPHVRRGFREVWIDGEVVRIGHLSASLRSVL